MKYTFSLLMLVLVVATSCRKKHIVVVPQPQYQYYRNCYFEPQARVDTMYNIYAQRLQYVIQGDTVHAAFRYVNGYNQLNVADGDFAENLMFQVDSGITSFSYSDAALKDHKVVYSNGSGMAGPSGYQLLEQGTISGDYLGNYTWIIRINVKLNYPADKTGRTILADTINAGLMMVE